MSQSEENTSVSSEPSKPWTTNEVQRNLALYFNNIDSLLLGRLLTLVETLGFSETREKAVKDVVKKEVRSTLGQVGRDIEWVIGSISKVGVSPDPVDSKESPESTRSLEYYRHWATTSHEGSI